MYYITDNSSTREISTAIALCSRVADSIICVVEEKKQIEKKISSDRRQSKALLTIEGRGSKISRNNVFDCHLSPVGRQMEIENFVPYHF